MTNSNHVLLVNLNQRLAHNYYNMMNCPRSYPLYFCSSNKGALLNIQFYLSVYIFVSLSILILKSENSPLSYVLFLDQKITYLYTEYVLDVHMLNENYKRTSDG